MQYGGSFSAVGGFRFLVVLPSAVPITPKYACKPPSVMNYGGKPPVVMQYGGNAFGGPGNTNLYMAVMFQRQAVFGCLTVP